MPFWSSQTLKARIPTDQLVVPYRESRVVHAAYEMGVGQEAYITSNASQTTVLAKDSKVVIPPGQFGLLVTQETVRIPANVVAFISIRAGIKFRGLINVSGFHVDPGYYGQLRFAVYNAGSQDIVLDQDERVFMLWFADLDDTDVDPYRKRPHSRHAITADHVAAIQGDVASPAELKKQLDDLKSELDKRFHATEHTRLLNRELLLLVLGLVLGAVVTIVGTVVMTDSTPSQQEGVIEDVPADSTPVSEGGELTDSSPESPEPGASSAAIRQGGAPATILGA